MCGRVSAVLLPPHGTGRAVCLPVRQADPFAGRALREFVSLVTGGACLEHASEMVRIRVPSLEQPWLGLGQGVRVGSGG